MKNILSILRGEDRRSIGRSNQIARDISRNSRLFARVFAAILSSDPAIRMGAADAIEKATRNRPKFLQPYKRAVLQNISRIKQQEVRWHVAQLLPRLQLTQKQRSRAVSILLDYLEDKSSIVRTCAMQALADLALAHPPLRPRVLFLLESLTSTCTPAMRSRGRKLLATLKRQA
jgi:HEAT repeat protein